MQRVHHGLDPRGAAPAVTLLAGVGSRPRGWHGHRPQDSEKQGRAVGRWCPHVSWQEGERGPALRCPAAGGRLTPCSQTLHQHGDKARPGRGGQVGLDSGQAMSPQSLSQGRVPREPVGGTEPRRAPGTQLRTRHTARPGLHLPTHLTGKPGLQLDCGCPEAPGPLGSSSRASHRTGSRMQEPDAQDPGRAGVRQPLSHKGRAGVSGKWPQKSRHAFLRGLHSTCRLAAHLRCVQSPGPGGMALTTTGARAKAMPAGRGISR